MERKIATIINYCSNEYPFLKPCVKEARKFSTKIYIPVCDHFFDGTEENKEELEETFSQFPDCQFLFYPFLPPLISKRRVKKLSICHLLHSVSRFLAVSSLEPEIEYVLFLDVDEIVDGERFLQWLNAFDLQKYDVLKLSNYWYFRDPAYQAKIFEDSAVFAKKEILTKERVFHKDERNAIYDLFSGPKTREVMGLDGRPMVHHYSWVRTKEEMLKKVRSWGHCHDVDWEKLVEEEFQGEFKGKDFVHGYDFIQVEPFIQLDRNKKRVLKKSSRLSNVLKINDDKFLNILGFKPKNFFTSLFSFKRNEKR